MKAKHYMILITSVILLIASALATIFTNGGVQFLFGFITLIVVVGVGMVIAYIMETA